jgi:superfamily II DNA or RNA helicase
VLIVVPTQLLKEQWIEELDKWGLGLNTEVQVMMGASKKIYKCDMLVIDEAHRVNSETISNILTSVKYKLILGLTATFERLDGRHEILAKYAPVCDTITLEVAKLNGWVSNFTEYQVIITARDLNLYNQYNKDFVANFEFFNFDFNFVMSLLGKFGFKNKIKLRDDICKTNPKANPKEVLKQINYHATAFMRALQNRKSFIYNHPQKLEVAREIIKYRSDKKIITFSANTKMAESVGIGYVYTGKEGKKKNRITLEEFSKLDKGVINSCQLANEGFDCPGLSVGIVMGLDSSATKGTQRTGRVVRKEGSKYAEMFTLVLENTVECDWFKNSHPSGNYITIDVDNLIKMLKGEPWEPYKKKVQNFTYRF